MSFSIDPTRKQFEFNARRHQRKYQKHNRADQRWQQKEIFTILTLDVERKDTGIEIVDSKSKTTNRDLLF